METRDEGKSRNLLAAEREAKVCWGLRTVNIIMYVPGTIIREDMCFLRGDKLSDGVNS